MDQLKTYSELVAQISGSVEDFVLNVSGVDVAGTSTSPQNASALESYISQVLSLDGAGPYPVSANLIGHFSPTPLTYADQGTTGQ